MFSKVKKVQNCKRDMGYFIICKETTQIKEKKLTLIMPTVQMKQG